MSSNTVRQVGHDIFCLRAAMENDNFAHAESRRRFQNDSYIGLLDLHETS